MATYNPTSQIIIGTALPQDSIQVHLFSCIFFKLFIANTAFTIYYEQFYLQTAFLKSPSILYKHVTMECFVRTKPYSQILCQIFIKWAVTNMAVVQNFRVYVQQLEYVTTHWSLAHEMFLTGNMCVASQRTTVYQLTPLE